MLWTSWLNRRISGSKMHMRSTLQVSLPLPTSRFAPILTIDLVDAQYKQVKARSAELLKQVEAALEERPEEAREESDRIISVRREYFNQLAAYEDALEEVGGDVEELRRQGIEKPLPDEDVREGDLRSLEELEVAHRTVQEQLEYNNNRDEGVVRSYEEKKNLVSCMGVFFFWCGWLI